MFLEPYLSITIWITDRDITSLALCPISFSSFNRETDQIDYIVSEKSWYNII